MFIVFTEQVKVITLGSDCSGLGSDFVALKLAFGPDIQLTKFAAESDETKMTWLNAVASHVGDETPDLIYHRTFGTGTTTQPPGHLCLRDSLSSLFIGSVAEELPKAIPSGWVPLGFPWIPKVIIPKYPKVCDKNIILPSRNQTWQWKITHLYKPPLTVDFPLLCLIARGTVITLVTGVINN